MNNLKIDLERGKHVARILFDKFNSEEGIFGHNVMPEDMLWDSDFSGIKVERGSYNHLMFITMVVSIDYMRNADNLWKAGRETMEDPGTKWLFSPEKVKDRPIEEIISAMKIHKLSQRHNKDSDIWKKVSISFATHYESDPRNLIEECGRDAFQLYERKYDMRFKKKFPSLSGNKIFPLWIRMLHDNVGINLKNLDKIPIPVDIHIARATFTTGCLIGEYEGNISNVTPDINETWKRIVTHLNQLKLKYPLQMDEALWHLSKYGCTSRKGDSCPRRIQCPVSKYCTKGLVKVSTKGIQVCT